MRLFSISPACSILLLATTFFNLSYASPIGSQIASVNETLFERSETYAELLDARAVTNDQIPTVAAFNAKLLADGPWSSRVAIFYTGGGYAGYLRGRKWFDQRPTQFPKVKECADTECSTTCTHTKKVPAYLYFGDLLGDRRKTTTWVEGLSDEIEKEALANGQPNKIANTAKGARGEPIDVMQTRLSQSMAETCTGDVYLLLDGTNSNSKKYSTWYGWEYPALTRNPNVDNIYRIDPTPSALGNDAVRIWKKGMGATTREPRGAEEPLQPGDSYEDTDEYNIYTDTLSEDNMDAV